MADNFSETMVLSVIEKEMGFTRQEFLNQFKCFAKDTEYTLIDNTIALSHHSISSLNFSVSSSIKIDLNELPDRIIGSLSIPRLSVKIHFYHFTELEMDQFVKNFDRSFQRGGG